MVVSSTHITTDDKCFDPDCLNCDCQFNTNKTFVEGMKHTCFNEVGTGEGQINFIGKAIKLINEYFADLTDEDYVNTFASGEKISTVLALSNKPEKSEDSVITTFAIYDETNQLVSFSHDTMTWDSMWYHNYCEMDIPGIPANAGTYEVVILFNGGKIGSQKFEITA